MASPIDKYAGIVYNQLMKVSDSMQSGFETIINSDKKMVNTTLKTIAVVLGVGFVAAALGAGPIGTAILMLASAPAFFAYSCYKEGNGLEGSFRGLEGKITRLFK